MYRILWKSKKSRKKYQRSPFVFTSKQVMRILKTVRNICPDTIFKAIQDLDYLPEEIRPDFWQSSEQCKRAAVRAKKARKNYES